MAIARKRHKGNSITSKSGQVAFWLFPAFSLSWIYEAVIFRKLQAGNSLVGIYYRAVPPDPLILGVSRLTPPPPFSPAPGTCLTYTGLPQDTHNHCIIKDANYSFRLELSIWCIAQCNGGNAVNGYRHFNWWWCTETRSLIFIHDY